MAPGANLPSIQPHLCVKGGLDAISFYQSEFDAVSAFKEMANDGKRVLHASLARFDGTVMLHDEFPEFGGDVLAPPTCGGASVAINVNLQNPDDVDVAIANAVSTDAVVTLPPKASAAD